VRARGPLMPARNKSKSPPAKKSPGQKSPGGGGGGLGKPLSTSKGVFTFTMVADGCYIEHKWGQNSGHVGVPLEAIPAFIGKLEALYAKTTGQGASSKKSPGSGPKGIVKGGKAAKEKRAAAKKSPREKKEPAPKKSMEDLDAELTAYTAERSAADAPITEA